MWTSLCTSLEIAFSSFFLCVFQNVIEKDEIKVKITISTRNRNLSNLVILGHKLIVIQISIESLPLIV